MNELESKELLDFAQLVADMRQAQKEYFRTKLFSNLEKSKRTEAKVDKALEEIFGGQQKLFS